MLPSFHVSGLEYSPEFTPTNNRSFVLLIHILTGIWVSLVCMSTLSYCSVWGLRRKARVFLASATITDSSRCPTKHIGRCFLVIMFMESAGNCSQVAKTLPLIFTTQTLCPSSTML